MINLNELMYGQCNVNNETVVDTCFNLCTDFDYKQASLNESIIVPVITKRKSVEYLPSITPHDYSDIYCKVKLTKSKEQYIDIKGKDLDILDICKDVNKKEELLRNWLKISQDTIRQELKKELENKKVLCVRPPTMITSNFYSLQALLTDNYGITYSFAESIIQDGQVSWFLRVLYNDDTLYNI